MLQPVNILLNGLHYNRVERHLAHSQIWADCIITDIVY